MQLHSPAFAEGALIPRLHTAEGADLSPPLCWSALPPGTRSLCLILDDPDAPAGLWVPWLPYDIPPETTGLPAGLSRTPRLTDGSCQGRCWGVRQFLRLGYHAPQPPPVPAHRYRFTLSALSKRLGWPPGATAPDLRQAIEPLILAEAQLHGTYAATASAARH